MEPEISVVVPTHNRPVGLEALLGALRTQTLAPKRFEVIVVDDGSEPRVAPADSVTVLRHDRPRGPSAARNAGWQAARGSLVAFTDDDCVPAPGWLEAIAGAAGRGGEDVIVQGPVGPPPEQRDEVGPFSHTIEVGGPNRFCVTCNIAYPRALLERIGGFDESFRRPSGEDVELGARALKAGGQIRFAQGALVHHPVSHPTLPELIRHTTKWTYSVKAVAMHPELRDMLVGRLFWKPTHPLVLIAAAGIATRRPLAALPYLAWYARLYRGDAKKLSSALPRHVAVDLAEIGTMVAGSIRYRTLML